MKKSSYSKAIVKENKKTRHFTKSPKISNTIPENRFQKFNKPNGFKYNLKINAITSKQWKTNDNGQGTMDGKLQIIYKMRLTQLPEQLQNRNRKQSH
jgi:phosphopantothenoylcysteine synthetase/decarboxylase